MNKKNSSVFIETLADQIALKLQKKHAVHPDSATEIGVEVAEEIRRLWGGLSIYICKKDTAGQEEKHREIYNAYLSDGLTPALCRRFGYTEQRIRQIIAGQGKVERV